MDKYEKESKLLLSADSAFISSIYKEVYPIISHHITKNSGIETEAEDIFQEAIAVTYKKLRDGDLTLTCSLKNFLIAVAKNMWLNKLREKKRHMLQIGLATDDMVSNTNLNAITEEMEREAIYKKHFEQLDAGCKNLLKLFFEGASMENIATKLRYGSTGYVRKKKFKCKEKLINSIKRDPAYYELVGKEEKK